MLYLKQFETEQEYNSYVEGDSLILPNVSFITESSTGKIKFNPLPQSNPANGYEYVDLGLPSGLKWAKCNIGANSESDYGLYFAWGETVGYSESDIENGIHGFYPEDYIWNEGEWQCDGSSMTKYNSNDSLTTLLPEDDAASVNMGGSWRMPSKEEYEELIDNTTSTWTTVNGVNGRLFTGNNGNTLFLPASGSYNHDYVHGVGSYGYYWSSSLDSSSPGFAYYVYFNSNNFYPYYRSRYSGLVVRGVLAN